MRNDGAAKRTLSAGSAQGAGGASARRRQRLEHDRPSSLVVDVVENVHVGRLPIEHAASIDHGHPCRVSTVRLDRDVTVGAREQMRVSQRQHGERVVEGGPGDLGVTRQQIVLTEEPEQIGDHRGEHGCRVRRPGRSRLGHHELVGLIGKNCQSPVKYHIV